MYVCMYAATVFCSFSLAAHQLRAAGASSVCPLHCWFNVAVWLTAARAPMTARPFVTTRPPCWHIRGCGRLNIDQDGKSCCVCLYFGLSVVSIHRFGYRVAGLFLANQLGRTLRGSLRWNIRRPSVLIQTHRAGTVLTLCHDTLPAPFWL